MHYQGGKAKQCNDIVSLLNNYRKPSQIYLEPFVGACSIFSKMTLPKIGGDIHTDLIMLLNYCKSGGELPDELTRDQYYALKNSSSSPLRGFAGFGCSYGGKWFGGYAKDDVRFAENQRYNTYCSGSKKSLLSKVSGLIGSVLLNVDYRYWNPKNCLIYCDPPYEGVTGYKDIFDHNEFWSVMREWSRNNTVLISEICAPNDFKVILESNKSKGQMKKGIGYIDRVFKHAHS